MSSEKSHDEHAAANAQDVPRFSYDELRDMQAQLFEMGHYLKDRPILSATVNDLGQKVTRLIYATEEWMRDGE